MKFRKRETPVFEQYSLIFPNLFTTGNLFCGFYAIVASLKGNYYFAAYSIMAAALFDMMDGRVARWVKGVSHFGKEYDSLADLVSFGVAPAIFVYLWALSSFPRLGWLASFLFVACGALRLARFNVISNKTDPGYFIGLPIPAAATIVATSYLFFRELHLSTSRNPLLLLMVFFMASLMVSTLKYKSYKKPYWLIKSEFFSNMVFLLLILIIVAINPEVLIFSLLMLYVVQGLVMNAVEQLLKLRKKPSQEEVLTDAKKT